MDGRRKLNVLDRVIVTTYGCAINLGLYITFFHQQWKWQCRYEWIVTSTVGLPPLVINTITGIDTVIIATLVPDF